MEEWIATKQKKLDIDKIKTDMSIFTLRLHVISLHPSTEWSDD